MLDVKNLHVRYGEIEVVSEVCLQVKKGQARCPPGV